MLTAPSIPLQLSSSGKQWLDADYCASAPGTKLRYAFDTCGVGIVGAKRESERTPSFPAKPARHWQSVMLTALLSDVVSAGQEFAAVTPPGQNDPAEHGSHTSTPPAVDVKVPAKQERVGESGPWHSSSGAHATHGPWSRMRMRQTHA